MDTFEVTTLARLDAPKHRITIELNDNDTFKHILKSDIEKLSLPSMPPGYTAFQVEIGGSIVFHVDRADFDKYLDQIKIRLSLLPYHRVRFHFLCSLDKLGIPLNYEYAKKARYVPNPSFVPEINEVTGECLNAEDARLVEYVQTDEKIVAPTYIQAPPIVLHLSKSDIPPFGKFEYIHKMQAIFLPNNIGSIMKQYMHITPLEKGLTLENAISRGTPFRAEYTNSLQYNGGLGGLLYSVG